MTLIDFSISTIFSIAISIIFFGLLIKYLTFINKINKQKANYKAILGIVSRDTFFDLNKCIVARNKLRAINAKDLPDYILDYVEDTMIRLDNTIEIYENLGNKSKDLEFILKGMNQQVEKMLNYVEQAERLEHKETNDGLS